MREHLRERALWLLTAVSLILFLRPLTTGTFYFRDIHQILYPACAFLSQALRTGVVPLWNPLLHAGMPFLADPVNLAVYPPNLLACLFPPVTAMNLLIIGHYPVAVAGAYLLARHLGIERSGAFVTGSVFGLCGFTLSLANHTQMLASFVFLPLTILGILRAVDEKKAGIAIAVVAQTFTVLAGSPEAILTAAFSSLAVSITAVTRVRRKRAVVVWAMAMALAGGLTLIRTLSTIEMVSLSRRSVAIPIETFTQWSLHPTRLPELVVSEFFGPLGRLSASDYWGVNRVDEGFPYILQIHYGVATLLLALAGTRSGRRSTLFRWTLATIALAGVALALGRHLPGFESLHLIPVISRFRYPEKFLMLGVLPIALLAGLGLERSSVSSRRHALPALVAGILLVALGAMTGTESAGGLWSSWFDVTMTSDLTDLLARRIAESGLVALLLGIAIALGERVAPPRRALLFAVVIGWEIVSAGTRVNQYAPRDFYDPPPAMSLVENVVGDGRLWAEETPDTAMIQAPTNDVYWQQRWNVEVLSAYSAVRFGIPVVYTADFDGLAPERSAALWKLLERLPWRQRIQLFRVGGVRGVISRHALHSSLHPVARLRNRSAIDYFLYEVPNAQMHRIVGSIRIANDPSAAIREVLDPGFDPSSEVVLETLPPSNAADDCEGSRANRLEAGTNRLRFDVSSTCHGYLVLAHSYDPGWRFEIDGTRAEPIRANFAFTALPVSPGRHEVHARYRPVGFVAGVAGSTATLGGILLGLFIARIRRRR